MNRSPLYLTFTWIFLLNHRTFGQQTFVIVWDQTYCMDPSRYPSSNYKLPQNSPCPVCVGDTLSLSINNNADDHYENLYRVNNVQDMWNCNATDTVNESPIVFNTMRDIPIENSGSSAVFQFVEDTIFYFISTSNGTQTSAMNDTMKTPGTCLQLSFLVTGGTCSGYGLCSDFTSILTNDSSPLSCPDSPTTSTSVAATTMSTDPMSTPNPVTTSTSATSDTGTIQQTPTVTTQSTSTQTPIIIRSPGSSKEKNPENNDAVIGWSFLLCSVIGAIVVVTPGGTVFLVLYYKGKIIFPCDKQNYSFFMKRPTENIEMGQTAQPIPIAAPENYYENIKS